MKIVHLIWSLQVGGAETMLVDILNEQAKSSHKLHLIIVNSEYNKKLIDEINGKTQIHFIERKPKSRNIIKILVLYLLLYKINPDCIHCHNMQLGTIIKLIKYRKCLTVHDVNLPIKNINTYDKLFVISQAVKSDILKRTGYETVLVNNGIKIELIKQREIYNYDIFRIIQVSRLDHEKKGQDILIKAIARIIKCYDINNIRLDIVGEGKSLSYLMDLVESEKIATYVSFLGMKNRNYLYNNLKNYELLVQPSRYEGFGLTVVEAMAAKIPVLVSNIDGPLEIIKNGQYGYLFESEKVESCASKIVEIMKAYEDSDIHLRMQSAYDYIENKYHIRKTAGQYISEYQN